MRWSLCLIAAGLAVCLGAGCERRSPAPPESAGAEGPGAGAKSDTDPYRTARLRMVSTQIAGRGVSDERVLEAMRTVPRHEFVPERYRARAYTDTPLPIGHEQTISQPFIVAIMTELAGVGPEDRVLEIGTGSGYQAAVLSVLAKDVYSIEILKPLADSAAERLGRLGYDNVTVKAGDGYRGWKEHAPFDAVIVTAAPDHVPQPLVDQLKVGGRLVIPVGDVFQELILITKDEKGATSKAVLPVRFVPMTGEAREKSK